MQIKLDAIKRYIMINTLSGVLPLYIVTEYPKSGGSWVSQMVSEYFNVPFPRNKAPKIQSCVMHGHNLYSPLMRNVICVLRDGRDVMTSAYFHRLFENDKNSPIMVRKIREMVPFDDYENVRKNMPAFIEHQARVSRRSLSPGKFTWGEFVDSWYSASAIMCKYEDMIESPEGELSRIVSIFSSKPVDLERVRCVVEKYSFSAQAKRQPGQENAHHFLRKGVSGDWRNKFTREAADVFDNHFGKHLIKLGYEDDDNWVAEYKPRF